MLAKCFHKTRIEFKSKPCMLPRLRGFFLLTFRVRACPKKAVKGKKSQKIAHARNLGKVTMLVSLSARTYQREEQQ